MQHFQQRLSIAAAPNTVYAALTTAAGLRGWWSTDCDADTANQPGSTLQFRFGPHYKHLRVEKLATNSEVHWRCTVAHIAIDAFTRHDEWVGTELAFRLTPTADGGTQLDFEHIGLEPTLECYDLCSNGWQHCLGSLRQYAETGQGEPHNGACAATAQQ